MKKCYKTMSLCIALMLGFTFAGAQNSKEHKKNKNSAFDGAKCFNENTHIINVGAGFANSRYYAAYRGKGYSYKTSPAFSISYEQAYPKKLGIGFLGLGVYGGFQSSSSTYNYYYNKNGYASNYYYKNNWTNFMVAARGVYHFDVLNAERAELYAGVLAGIRIQSYHYVTNNPDPYADNYRLTSGSVYPVFSVFAGGRWYFVKNVALFAEVGYGVSFLTGGFSFKF